MVHLWVLDTVLGVLCGFSFHIALQLIGLGATPLCPLSPLQEEIWLSPLLLAGGRVGKPEEIGQPSLPAHGLTFLTGSRNQPCHIIPLRSQVFHKFEGNRGGSVHAVLVTLCSGVIKINMYVPRSA